MKLTGKVFILGFLIFASFCTLSASNHAAEDTLPKHKYKKLPLYFRSLQFDATYFIFTNGIVGSLDIDIWRRIAGGKSNIGLRGGVERYRTGGPGGETSGSPFVDYNLLLRSTVDGDSFRWDIYIGYVYHTSNDESLFPSKSLLKFGMELKWMFVPKICGLLAKASGVGQAGTIGVGFTLGFGQ